MKFLLIAWLCTVATHAANLPLADEGKQVFALSCSVGYCHGIEGRAGRGPRLRDRTLSRTYLYDTIENGIPGSSMPAWRGRLSEHSIDAVIAYVLSIGKEQPESAGVKESAASNMRANLPIVSQQAALGKLLFFDLTKDKNCGVCHRVGDSGTAIAPTFTNMAANSELDVVKQIVGPPSHLKTLKVITSEGEMICGVEAARSAGWVRIYDVAGAGPPVLRTIDSGSISKLEPCVGLNVHEGNIRLYSKEELVSIAAFVKSLGESQAAR